MPVLVPWNLPCPEIFWLHACNQAFCKTLHLKCLIVFWICLCPDNCSVICTVTLHCVLHQTHLEFWYIQNSVYSGICRHIQEYLALLMHIQAYSAPYVTLSYSQSCHILSPGIVARGGMFKTLWNFDQAYSEPCHRTVYSGIVQAYSGIFQKILRTLP